MPDKDDTGRSGRTKTTVTWRGIVDVPEEDEPKRPGALSATGKGLNRALAAVGLARPRNEDGSRGPRRTKRLAGLVGGVVVVALLVSMGHIVQAGTVAVPELVASL